MSERKYRCLFLALFSGMLLVIGMFAYENTGNFPWLIPGIIAYIVDIVYYMRKPARIVWDETEKGEGHE